MFAFDFNFVGPIQFLDRYMRILNCENDKDVRDAAISILVLQQFDEKMLDYNISQITAVALILAINIVKISELL